MPRPREHGEHTRRALLDAAARILEDEGPAALSVRRVADEVGTTTRAIYSLFGSKAGLVRAIHREGFETLDRHLAAVEETDDPVADLRRLGLAYRDAALENAHLYGVMFAASAPQGFEPTEADVEFSLGTLARLRRCVDRCVATGVFPDRDVEDLTFELWALVHGLASLELGGALGEGATAERRWREVLAAAATGYAAPS